MQVEALASNLANAGSLSNGGGPAKAAPAAADANAFSQAVNTAQAAPAAASPATSSVPAAQPPAESFRASSRPQRDSSLGDRILNRLADVHHKEGTRSHAPQASSTDPVVKAAPNEPGPASAALREVPTGLASQQKVTGRSPGDFSGMLDQLQAVYNQVIQVSVVSKSTGSFTSSMNRLMSSS